MRTPFTPRSVFTGLTIFCLSCVGEAPLPKNGESATVTAEPAGPNCAAGGVKIQVGTQPASYVCNGSNGVSVDGGVAQLAVTNEPAGTNCVNGGIRVQTGSDAPLFICNGTKGSAGAGTTVTPEAPGTNCSAGGVRIDSPGSGPTYVCNGVTGATGDAGAGVTVTIEPVGTNCSTGGVRIQSSSGSTYVCNGLVGDAGASPSITNEPVGANCARGGVRIQVAGGAPSYVCNGAPGDAGVAGARSLIALTDEGPGLNCEVGGVRIDTGVDVSGNGALEPSEVAQSRFVCGGIGVGTGFVRTATPDFSTVFNSIERTFRYTTKCSNSIWNRQADVIVSGISCDASNGTRLGYWAHSPDGGYPASPDNDLAQTYSRLVQVPATNSVVFTVGAADPSSRGAGDSSVPNIRVGTISPTTGLISNAQPAVFSDSYTGSCPLLSSSRTHVLCYDGATTIRFYRTTANSPTLTAGAIVTLPQTLPQTARCPVQAGQWCMGGTFAYDGAFFYFAEFEGGNDNRTYLVFSATGTPLGTRTASGVGNINGTYFDWSVGRYSTSDVFGVRSGGLVFGTMGSTHSFGPISANHTFY